ncbi:MAG: DUF3169 family protein [Lachnospiraceae bacterium]|nr:DUF3169 family protein [Lachnospiraceae bacterium]
MTDRREEIKKENKRAVPIFLLLICAGGLVGGLLGGAGTMIRFRVEQGDVFFGEHLITYAAFIIMIAVALLVHIAGWITYVKCRNQLKAWDGEDEEGPNRIEIRSQYAIWGVAVNSIVSFACFAILMSYLLYHTMEILFITIAVAFFVINLFTSVFMQQKFVDLLKEMNPEKKGSVYDVKFTEKWMESCDEAEKMQTYQSAWSSYRYMGTIYPFVWLITYLADLFLGVGIFASVVVAILWLIQTSIYCHKAIRLSR